MHIATGIIRIGIGGVLVYSGLIKLLYPYEFLNSVLGYHLVGPKLATLVAATLPCLELAIGAALVCGAWTVGAALLASALFLAFSVGQASALVRGIEADCGCFGAVEPVSWVSLLRTVALLGGAMLCAWRHSSSTPGCWLLPDTKIPRSRPV